MGWREQRNTAGTWFLFGILITVVALVWVQDIRNFLDYLGHYPCSPQKGGYEQNCEPYWWRWISALVSGEDSIAQWLMMALTGVTAMLLFYTLRASNTTVNITREVGEKQFNAAMKAVEAAGEANAIAAKTQEIALREYEARFKPDIEITFSGVPIEDPANWSSDVWNNGGMADFGCIVKAKNVSDKKATVIWVQFDSEVALLDGVIGAGPCDPVTDKAFDLAAGERVFLDRMTGKKLVPEMTPNTFQRTSFFMVERTAEGCVSKVVEILRRRPPSGLIWA